MSLDNVRRVLGQAKELGTVEWVFFEGGEPFLHYPVLLSAVRTAARQGFRVGLVTNCYWATDKPDCAEWLGPLAGLADDLTISCDWYHWDADLRPHVKNACAVAGELGMRVRVSSVVYPGCLESREDGNHLPTEEVPVMYRGRASQELAPEAPARPWLTFTSCEHEDLRDPGRVHVDPLGNVHVCQGISIGNVYNASLRDVCRAYEPDLHPIVGPLLEGGPVELVLRYGLDHKQYYADACHACYQARAALRGRFPEILAPDQMYGVKRELDPLESLTLD
jgi:MoaA/NifB/PqqE/SkfB family radical SAM enzyme